MNTKNIPLPPPLDFFVIKFSPVRSDWPLEEIEGAELCPRQFAPQGQASDVQQFLGKVPEADDKGLSLYLDFVQFSKKYLIFIVFIAYLPS